MSVRRPKAAPYLRAVSSVAVASSPAAPVVLSNPFRTEIARVRAAQRAIQSLSNQISADVSAAMRKPALSDKELQKLREDAVRGAASKLRELLPMEESLTFARDIFAEAIGFMRPLSLPKPVREWMKANGQRQGDKPDLELRAEAFRQAAAEFDALIQDWTSELRTHRTQASVSTKELEALRNRATHDGIQRLMDVGIEARHAAEAAVEAFFQSFGTVGHELRLEPRAQKWFERTQSDVASFASAFIR